MPTHVLTLLASNRCGCLFGPARVAGVCCLLHQDVRTHATKDGCGPFGGRQRTVYGRQLEDARLSSEVMYSPDRIQQYSLLRTCCVTTSVDVADGWYVCTVMTACVATTAQLISCAWALCIWCWRHDLCRSRCSAAPVAVIQRYYLERGYGHIATR